LGEGYTLIVCEKPDAARRISESLAETRVERMQVEGTEVLRFKRGGEEFVVGSALGHIYGVSDPFGERGIYPVFDVEWYPGNVLEGRLSFAKGRIIESFRKLSLGAVRFINACDYDLEGETIGFNILRYACGGKEREALRARFSTMTKEDLLQAFQNARSPSSNGLAVAGRTRHAIDFIWGVNLSRALFEAAQRVGSAYKNLSIGRVQGPTLSYVVDREVEIRTFVPEPFWAIKGVFQVGGVEFEARYAVERLLRKADAERIEEGCRGRGGIVSKASRGLFEETPPTPFNTGDLQREAYRVFGYAPTRTLQIAERLYLDALVSYPRTSSQKLPPSIGYAKIFEGLGRMEEYSGEADELRRGALHPKEGSKYDTAHPAVYPTGERPRRALSSWEARLLDLVIRRFMATFAPNAVRARASVIIKVGEFEFKASGRRTVKEGWLRYYGRYSGREEKFLPTLKKSDEVGVVSIESTEEFTTRPPRYNQSSLLERMERENLGTKATRAEIISTLISRGYIVGEQMMATDLGFAVVETMRACSPAVASTRLTREIEEKLREIESGGEDASTLLGQTIRVLSDNLVAIASNEESIGLEMSGAISSAIAAQYILGPCPVCKTGKLKVVRSRKTRKRFVGCTNYPGACDASAPLPQRGAIRTTTRACGKCDWPIVYVRLGRFPWRLCVNPRCPSKVRKKHEMQVVQKRS